MPHQQRLHLLRPLLKQTVTYRYPDPKTSNSKQFLRLRVTMLP